jgi:hypothetical protein
LILLEIVVRQRQQAETGVAPVGQQESRADR